MASPSPGADTQMKYLLYAAVAGASLWIITELLELLAINGHTPLSLWLTTVWHPVLALGFWGLHKSQSPGQNTLSLVATVAMVVALVAFAPLSVMFLYSGSASIDGFMQQHRFFAVAGLLMLLGTILFSAAMIRARHYAAWMAYGLIAALLLVVIQTAGGFPELLQHAGFIALSLIIISMALSALRRLRLQEASG